MIWVALIGGIIFITGMIVTLILVALRICDALVETLRVIGNDRARSDRHVAGLIDRLMSQDWQAVRLHEGVEETEEGGFFPPGEDEEEPIVEMAGVRDGRWGRMGPMRDRFEATEDEQTLIDEDFPELNHEST